MDSETNFDKILNDSGPILHVVLVAFNHKRGCEIEYVYPAFDEGLSSDHAKCPEEWKHLPSLALPDGSHNFEKDTVFFHMPSRVNNKNTVYGISCYRQINAECLINKSEDITRGTVQKSVCVLSTLPLYGLINAKLELVTHAYFDEKDFSKVALLEETYKYLNSSLKENLSAGHQIFLGLSVRDLVFRFKHRIVLLLKLILLERKVLFLKSPVNTLCTTILSLLSIFPGMIEDGLLECLTPYDEEKSDFICYLDEKIERDLNDTEKNNVKSQGDNVLENNAKLETDRNLLKKASPERDTRTEQLLGDLDELLDGETKEKVDLTKSKLEFCDKETYSADSDISDNCVDAVKGSTKSLASECSNESIDGNSRRSFRGRIFNPFSYWSGKDKSEANVPEEYLTNGIGEHEIENMKPKIENEETLATSESTAIEEPCFSSINNILNLDPSTCGFPLRIFGNGMLCHPYISLPFLDLLKNDSVRGFIAGATNVLFKQKRNLIDVIIDLDEGKIDILDFELRKELYLTTEDLRFGDYLVKNVLEDQNDVFLDGTGWEGGDEWLRVQLKFYLLCLLRTSLLQDDNRMVDTFNQLFMVSWKKTHNYLNWLRSDKDGILEINPGHPFHGQMSMADMKLRLSHTMQNSERGKKINQAVVNTGKAVLQTSKVLGGAISQAKSAVFSWFQVSNSPSPESGDA